MKRIIFGVLSALLLLVLPMEVRAEGETILYSYDFSKRNGGSPEDYQYSFDKENWTSENTWELEVGKEYNLYVKYPDGYIGLAQYFIAEKDMDIRAAAESNALEEASSGSEEAQTQTQPQQETENGEDFQTETEDDNSKVIVYVLVAVAIAVGIAAVIFLVRKKGK